GDNTLRNEDAIREALAKHGIRMSRPLGFNNTYAIGMKKPVAARLGLSKISDVVRHPELKFGFTNEFMNRGDGWPSLKARYRLPQQNVVGIEHVLAYQALESRTLDPTDLHSTDAEILKYDLQVLEDDLHHFPPYYAVLLYRADLADRSPEAMKALLRMEGLISAEEMQKLNARTTVDQVRESQVAADFLNQKLGQFGVARRESAWRRLLVNTLDHFLLVPVSLTAAIVAAVPLGILAARGRVLGQGLLAAAGIVQTVPSLALLVFMVVLLDGEIGAKPAIIALFLYSLLPI